MSGSTIRTLPLLAGLLLVTGCETEPDSSGPQYTTGYRSGVEVGNTAFDYTSSGERGSMWVTEVNWAGSVEGALNARVHHPDDIFIEIQNRHPRDMWLTRWIVVVKTSSNLDRLPNDYLFRNDATRAWVLPAPRSGRPLAPNAYAVIAARDDGAFASADYIVPGFTLPQGPFEIELYDPDERIIDAVGDVHKELFAGAWDQVTARSMERSQVLFGNLGGRDASWHSYSLNDFDQGSLGQQHAELRANVAEGWRTLTFATPGLPNSPDYSGSVSSGAED